MSGPPHACCSPISPPARRITMLKNAHKRTCPCTHSHRRVGATSTLLIIKGIYRAYTTFFLSIRETIPLFLYIVLRPVLSALLSYNFLLNDSYRFQQLMCSRVDLCF